MWLPMMLIMNGHLLLLLSRLLLLTTLALTKHVQRVDGAEEANSNNSNVEYGVDVSFPMHHFFLSTNYPWLPHNVNPTIETPPEYVDMPLQPLGNRQQFYDDFLQSCVEHFQGKGDRCYQSEMDRIAMSLRQPQSMQNYTELGFAKIRAPEKVFQLIKEFWDNNKDNVKPEAWTVGETVTNNWQTPTGVVGLHDTNLRGGGVMLQHMVWNAARDTIEEWTHQELTDVSLYGIRIYYEGSILATHVDRLPLVSSAIIQVAQDVDEPWPLEVIGHNGKAYNITMEPGDMVLYESHSVLHGRPFPLKGRFVANVFVHFEPTGHSRRHNASDSTETRSTREKYRDAVNRSVGGHESDQATESEDEEELASYVIPGSPEALFIQENPKFIRDKTETKGTTIAHHAAQMNDLKSLQDSIEMDKDLLNARDENGWTPLHEAASAGYEEVVTFLLERGADVNAQTEDGATVLSIAQTGAGSDHPVIELLTSWGASMTAPDPEL